MVAVGLSKIVIVAVNVIFMIFGLAILIIGIIFKAGWDDVRNAFDEKATEMDFDLQTAGDAAGVSAITFGAIILIVALFGCAGACCENKCLLGTYGVIVTLVLISQIGIVAFLATKGKDAEGDLKKALVDSLKDYNETSSTDISKSWSAIFKMGECCAVIDFKTDFKTNPFKRDLKLRAEAGVTGTSIPITCCRGVNYEDSLTKNVFKEKSQCLDTPTSKNAYTTGCYETIQDWIESHKKIIIGVGVAILIFELILAAMAFFLCCRADD